MSFIFIFLLKLSFLLSLKICLSTSYSFLFGGFMDDPVSCKSGHFINEYRLQYSSTSTVIGIEVSCVDTNGKDRYEIGIGGNATWSTNVASRRGGKYMAIGWQTVKSNLPPAVSGGFVLASILSEDRPLTDMGLIFSSDGSATFVDPNKKKRNIFSSKGCPPDHVLCGMQTQRSYESKEVLDVSFSCCYYCEPHEGYVPIKKIINDGFSPLILEIGTTVGLQSESRKTAGGSVSQSKSQDKEFTEGKSSTKEKGFSFIVSTSTSKTLSSTFTNRFSSSETKSYNWENSLSSMWSEQKEEKFTLTCEPQHECLLEQFMGYCGKYQVLTPVIQKSSQPIKREDYKLPDSSLPVNMGERRSYPPIKCGSGGKCLEGGTSSPHGNWQKPGFCPRGFIVTGFELKLYNKLTEGLVDVRLYCSQVNGSGWPTLPFPTVTVGSDLATSGGKKFYRSQGQKAAVGFYVKEFSKTVITNFALRYKEEEEEWTEERVPELNFFLGKWSEEFSCGEDYAICGIQTQIMSSQNVSIDYGALTAIRVRCCFFCIPEERWVTIESVINRGFTETSHNTRTMVGSRNDDTSRKGASESSDSSYDYESLRMAFSSKYGSSSSSNFNWENTLTSTWYTETEKSFTFSCEPRHTCEIKQLVGVCGSREVKTARTEKISTALDVPPPPPPSDAYLTQMSSSPQMHCSPSHTCIQLDIQGAGLWQTPAFCPPSLFVTGFQLRTATVGVSWGGLGHLYLTGISLLCSLPLEKHDNDTQHLMNDPMNMTKVISSWSPQGDEHELETFSNSTGFTTPAVGFYLKLYNYAQSPLRNPVTNFALRYKNEEEVNLPNYDKAYGNWTDEIGCQSNYAICGLQTKVFYANLDEDSLSVTNVRVKCCFYCIPEEKLVFLANMENAGYSEMSQSIRTMVGTRRDFGAHKSGSSTPSYTIDAEGLHAGFSARFGNSSTFGFNWEETSSSMWTTETDKTIHFQCEPRHSCTLRQLVGHCGSEEIKTPHIIKESFPLEDFVATTVVTPYRRDFVEIGGEEEDDSSGEWEEAEFCPENWLVTGLRLKFHPKVGHGLSTVLMRCSPMSHNAELLDQEKIIEAGIGHSNPGQWSSSFEYLDEEGQFPRVAVGFALAVQKFRNPHDPRSNICHNLGLKFDTAESILGPKTMGDDDVGDHKWTDTFECPNERAVCGIQTRILPVFPNKHLVTSIKMMCCPYCTPSEEILILDTFYNYGTTMTEHQIKLMTSNQQDTRVEQQRTYDQAGYAAKYGGRHLSAYHGTDSASSSRSNSTDNFVTYWCEARHVCMMQKIVESCGGNVTSTRLVKKVIPFDPPEEEGGGESMEFIEISALGDDEESEGREWEVEEFCPVNVMVDGYRLKRQGQGLQGISLRCTPTLDPSSKSDVKTNETHPEGDDDEEIFVQSGTDENVNVTWSNMKFLEKRDGSTESAIGFVVRFIPRSNLSDSTVTDFALNYPSGPAYMDETGEEGQWSKIVNCPKDSAAVCGLQTRLRDEVGANKAKRVVADIKLKCCAYCTPKEELSLLESLLNDGVTATTIHVNVNTGVQGEGVGSPDEGTFYQSIFAKGFAIKMDYGFNWANASTSMWTTKGTKTMDFVCEPRHLCTIQQVVGVCGHVSVNTPHIIRQSICQSEAAGWNKIQEFTRLNKTTEFDNLMNGTDKSLLSKF